MEDINEVKRYFGWMLLLIYSCQNGPRSLDHANPIVHQAHRDGKDTEKIVHRRLKEFFTDSLHVGRKSFNKIELSEYRLVDSNYVIIKFYSKLKKGWQQKNEFHFAKDDVAACDTKLSDFNRDGLNDMTYVSDVGARGANEIRKLFIYDKANDRLIYMKNSEEYPNLLYNKALNCIDAFLVYGGCSTVFLKIDGDSLREFANVELFHGLTVTIYGRNNKERIIFRDPKNNDRDIRYKNFKPLEAYDDY